MQTREIYGPLRPQAEFVAQGFDTARDRIVRLWLKLGLSCKQKRKYKATTNLNHSFPLARNRLEQTFAPTHPNQAWLSDITSSPSMKDGSS